MNLKKIEEKWNKRWNESKIFEANPDEREKFFITVPYPYVSGPYHIGHGRSYVCGDIFARYRRLMGYNVLFPMAFHITGTPVLAVSISVKMKDEKALNTLRKYISYHTKDEKEIEKTLMSFAEPINVYSYFSKTMKKDFNSLGMSLDWRREFTTADRIYNKFIEWQFLKLKEKKYLIKGDYPITFCLNCVNAVGEDDIKDGDTDPVSINEFVLLKFRLAGQNIYLIAATLRPETVFGQTNLWINPESEYVKVKVGDEIWIVSKECSEKLSYQKTDIKILEKIEPSELIGKKCFAPGIEKEIIVLPSSFCDPDTGTGIVTSVPSSAPYDLVALRELQRDRAKCEKYGLDYDEIGRIKPIKIIKTKEFGDFSANEIVEQFGIKNQTETQKLDEATNIVYKTEFNSGVMNKNCGEYSGMSVAKAKEKMKDYLIKNKKADVFFETSRKAKCRCGGKIIIAKLKDQWFLDYNTPGWKKLAYECLNNMTIYPEKYRQNFKSAFEWLDKRPCARKRGLGTKLPFDKKWIIESLSDSTIYMAFYTIAHLIKNNKIPAEQLKPEVFDFIFLDKGEINDVAEKSKISQQVLKKMKTEFEYWYPVDQRHTAIMHISNHLSFFIFHHAAIFPKKYWPRTITLIEPVLVEGTKMGKSKGNVIPLAKISENYGTDVFRLYMAYQAEFGAKIDWREENVQSVKKQLQKLYNLISSVSLEENKDLEISLYGKALLSKFTKNIKKARDYINNFDLRKYVQVAFYDVMKDISNYIRLSKKEEQNSVLLEIFKKWLVLLSPVIPYTSEELWEKIGGKGFISLSKWPEVEENNIDETAEKNEKIICNLLDDIKVVMDLAKIKPKKIKIVVPEKWKYELFSNLNKKLKETRDFGELMKESMKFEESRKKSKEIQRLIKKFLSSGIYPYSPNEEKLLDENKQIFEKEFKCEVEIIREQLKESWPGKFGILVE